ncbi:MAG: tRNA (adenosine(37)-N6)-threonylcarbamoyltransferase complex ATPase subunit type 1 TsaE [Candidatus Omnitrophica bacterium]|nr:tRNA (adenosine(37)-N6)-threonylcarbamoyltransferase complex ATPase subunit type 1 TsaE [Candidatus Omnitrophota bacterium]
MYIKSFSENETIKLGEKFSKFLRPKDVVILDGWLGSGKTIFTKGILKGFGVRKLVTSPTFTLIKEYKKSNTYIYHVDLYRIDRSDFETIGLEDILYKDDSIVLIEWGKKICNLLSEYIRVKFHFLSNNSRRIFFSLKSKQQDRISYLKNIFCFK